MILWGPPGCGKTTLALLLARYADAEFAAISAVLCGLPQVREVLAEAQARFDAGRRTVLFVDEVHRFNKAQQDAFLPYVEDGPLTLIGPTTANPGFATTSALLSRVRVYVLNGRDAVSYTHLDGYKRQPPMVCSTATPSLTNWSAAIFCGSSPSLTSPRLTQSLTLVSLTRLLPMGEPPKVCSNPAFSRISGVTL